MAEKHHKKFSGAWMKRGSKVLPPAPFRLGKAALATANERAEQIRVPLGFDWRPRPFFQGGMKSHE